MTAPEPQTPTPEPSAEQMAEARKVICPGCFAGMPREEDEVEGVIHRADLGGITEVFTCEADPEIDDQLELTRRVALALAHEREKAAKVMDGIEQTLRDAASSYGRREIGIREDLRREADEVARAAAAIRSGGGR